MPSGIVSGLMGLAMSLRETSVKVPKSDAGAHQRRGGWSRAATAASKCAGVEAGSCKQLRSPQRRSLVARGSSRATTTIKAAFPVVNAETPTQLCRDFAPQARSRSQLEAVELFASTWGGTDDTSASASLAAIAHVRVGIAIGVALASLSPSRRNCDQKGSADEHCEL